MTTLAESILNNANRIEAVTLYDYEQRILAMNYDYKYSWSADGGNTIRATTGRTSLLFSDGNDLTHLGQAAGGQQPLWKGGQKNGHPALIFDTTRTDYMDFAASVPAAAYARWYFVLNNPGKVGLAFLTYAAGSGADAANVFYLGSAGHNNEPSITGHAYGPSTTGWHLYGFAYTPTAYKTFLDDSADVSAAGVPNIGNPMTGLGVNSAGNMASFDVARIIMLGDAGGDISADDDAIIRAYLNGLYDLY